MFDLTTQTLSRQKCCKKIHEHLSVKKAKALFYGSFGNAHAYRSCYNSVQNKNPGWGLNKTKTELPRREINWKSIISIWCI